MSGKIILLIMKIILLIMKTILRIVVLEKGFPARAQEKMFVGRAVNLASKWSVENERLSCPEIGLYTCNVSWHFRMRSA